MSVTKDTLQDHFVKAVVYSEQLKEIFEEQLMARPFVRWLTDFPEGDMIQIPSIGQGAPPADYVEDTPVTYTDLDTGAFQFVINEYLSTGNYITEKAKQDSWYGAQVEAMFVPKQARAMEERLEADIFDLQSKQTAANSNTINGVPHRWVGKGTSNGATTLSIEDFSHAKYALKKANAPLTNLVCVVDPSVSVVIETDPNLRDVSFNPQWEGIITSGMTSGFRFIRNIYGWDVYESNFLSEISAETINGRALDVAATDSATGTGRANMFMTMAPGAEPFVGAWRQMPKVDAEFNKDFQRTEYVTTARYGLDLFRPESLVVVLSADNTVAV
jgi:hypothetical protein